MKKVIGLSICLLLLVVCFTGCRETQEYRNYRNFSQSDTVGMDKQEVLRRIGHPDIYGDAGGNLYRYRSNPEDALYYRTTVVWVYECYQHRDPADPYRLCVSFDSEGKCTKTDFSFVPGG